MISPEAKVSQPSPIPALIKTMYLVFSTLIIAPDPIPTLFSSCQSFRVPNYIHFICLFKVKVIDTLRKNKLTVNHI